MKIFSFCDQFLHKEIVRKLCELGWLYNFESWFFLEEKLLRRIEIDTKGIDPRKIFSILPDSEEQEDPAIVLTEKRLAIKNNERSRGLHFNGKSLVISICNLLEDIDYRIQIGIYQCIWPSNGSIKCSDPKCLFRPNLSDSIQKKSHPMG